MKRKIQNRTLLIEKRFSPSFSPSASLPDSEPWCQFGRIYRPSCYCVQIGYYVGNLLEDLPCQIAQDPFYCSRRWRLFYVDLWPQVHQFEKRSWWRIFQQKTNFQTEFGRDQLIINKIIDYLVSPTLIYTEFEKIF